MQCFVIKRAPPASPVIEWAPIDPSDIDNLVYAPCLLSAASFGRRARTFVFICGRVWLQFLSILELLLHLLLHSMRVSILSLSFLEMFLPSG